MHGQNAEHQGRSLEWITDKWSHAYNRSKTKQYTDLLIDEYLNDYQRQCVWKGSEQDIGSTTFRDIDIQSDLYRCVSCNGYDHGCDGYVLLRAKGKASRPSVL
jgi:hypothetical protein